MATTSLRPPIWLGRALARLPLVGDDRRWLVPIGLALYIPVATWDWNFPNEDGIPFNWVWLALASTAVGALRLRRGTLDPIATAAIIAVSGMIITDIAVLGSQAVRDLELYVKAGERWLVGVPAFLLAP